MKKIFFLVVAFASMAVSAQIPQGFSYQAVVRDSEGKPLVDQTVGVRISLLSDDGKTVHFIETHSKTTSSQGVISLTVGEGNSVSGSFEGIPWSTGNISIKIEIDPAGGTSYTELGTTKLMAVPYALFASNSEGTIPGGTAGQILVHDGAAWSASSNIYTNPGDSVGIGTTTPEEKLHVVGNIKATGSLIGQSIQIGDPVTDPDEPLFVVRNSAGLIVFAVYESGVRVYVDSDPDVGKAGSKGGFAIGGLSPSKENSVEYFRVTPDSVRVYIDSAGIDGKGPSKGGFAIGGLSPSKGGFEEYLRITPDSSRIYVKTDDSKGPRKGGFAIGGLSPSKSITTKYFHVTDDSTTIATSDPSMRVVITTPTETVPLLSIDGSMRMGADASSATGSISFDGAKFLTYEGGDGKEVIWKQFVVTGTPEVSTDSVFNILRNSVSVAGRVLIDGGSEVVARGVCYSTLPSPTLGDSSIVSGSGVGPFTVTLSGLMGSTTYYVRAYATNSQFTSFGQEAEFTTLPPVLPSVTTSQVSSITSTSAVSGGTITDDGSAPITSRGVCWNTAGSPTLSDSFTSDGTGKGSFTSSIAGLEVNRTYFVRAYALNSVGIFYGEEYIFATTDLPVLSTNPITAVTGTSATSGGNIFAGGELEISQRGVCWNTTGNPTVDNSKTENGPGSGSFVSSITGLTLGTTYFVRAYATNATGTAYGNEYFFTTLNVPTLNTSPVTNVTGSSASAGGNVVYNGGAVVTGRGLCWGTSENPTINDSKLELGDGSGEFSGEITGLEIGTNYYVRAYATNGIGTGYGNQRLFTTQNYATVVTAEVWDITYTTAKGGGNVTSDGGADITQRGICWNTEGTPTLENSHTEDGEGTGEFASNLTGLAANNTYYVRAYAINNIGTTYGQELSFSTPTIVPPPPGLPVVGTVTITTSNDGYHTGGYVMSDGGSAVTQRGVCWSTSENPTTGDSFSTDGEGIGLYNSLIASLAGCGDTYFVRAYATNSTGTGYGNQLSVSSGLLPLVESTATITDITKISAVSGGTVTSDGGCTITERGICWSRKPNPTIDNFKATAGSGIGSFTATMSGLYPNDTYYVRAYATNSVATIYGPEHSFTTIAGSSGAAIGQFYAGGYVFYLDETGDHGLVSATEDITNNAPWGCIGTSIPTGTDVGTGMTNTAAIIAGCAEEDIAARLCDGFESNGYSDWFLPSKDELFLMWQDLHQFGIGDFSSVLYWSSSQDNISANPEGYAFVRDFGTGGQGGYTKHYSERVRAVRAF